MNAIKLTLGAVTVVLCTACGPSGAGPSASSASCGPPRLTILSPVSGETVRAPLPVQFRVDCFRVGAAPYGHLHAWAGPPQTSPRFELRVGEQAGVVEIPNPQLSGERTLTFQLARADHTPVRNPEARVVIGGVIFEGP